MADKETSRVLLDELRRVLGEFRSVDARIAELVSERRQKAAIAHRLALILKLQYGATPADRLLAEAGLKGDLAALPGLPGRKAAIPEEVPTPRRTPRTGRAPVRREGRRATTAATPPEAVAKDTPIRMLSGLYKGWTGILRWTRVQGSKITYTVALQGPGGQRGRTQIAHTSLGQSWEILDSAAPKAKPAAQPAPPSTRTVHRRPARKDEVKAAPAKPEPAAPAEAKAAPTGPVPKGTPIRMLAGIYQGYTGRVASVQAKSTRHGTEAIYMLALTGPEGQHARTSVKHSSLGRMWTRAG